MTLDNKSNSREKGNRTGGLHTSSILDQAFTIYKNAFTSMLPIYGVLFIGMAAVSFVLVFWGFWFVLPLVSGAGDNAALSGIYFLVAFLAVMAFIFCFFRSLLDGAASLVATNYQRLFFRPLMGILLKNIGRIFSIYLAKLFVWIPVLFFISFLVYFTTGFSSLLRMLSGGGIDTPLYVLVSLFIFCYIIYVFCAAFLNPCIAVGILNKQGFMRPVKESFLFLTREYRLFKLMAVYALWFPVSLLGFYLYYRLAGFIPIPSSLPMSQYAADIYRLVPAYFLTVLTAPLSNIINYSIPGFVNTGGKNGRVSAGLGSRWAATLIDCIVLLAFVALTAALAIFCVQEDGVSLTLHLSALSLPGWSLIIFSLLVVFIVYNLFFETVFHGQTPGKMAMNIGVVHYDGDRPGFFQSLMRSLLKVFPDALLVGAIMMLITGKRVGDYLAGTQVVYKK